MPQGKVLGFFMSKGGTAKTTTAHAVGAYLARQGYRVMLVDADPQSNLTVACGVPPLQSEYTLHEVLLNVRQGYDANMAITRRTELDSKTNKSYQFDLIPSRLSLASVNYTLASEVQRENLLLEALEPVKSNYDYVIIDTEPSLGLLVMNALVACDSAIAVVSTQTLPYSAIPDVIRTINLAKRINKTLDFTGILLTMAENNNLSREVVEAARAQYAELVFSTVIPRNVDAAAAPGFGESIFQYNPKARSADAYKLFVKELLNRYAEKQPSTRIG